MVDADRMNEDDTMPLRDASRNPSEQDREDQAGNDDARHTHPGQQPSDDEGQNDDDDMDDDVDMDGMAEPDKDQN